MEITNKGYELTLQDEEMKILHKISGNFTGSTAKDLGLTKDEEDWFGDFYTLVNESIYAEET